MVVFQRLYSYLTVPANRKIMAAPELLCSCFQVNAVGFVSPVADLLAFRVKGKDVFVSSESLPYSFRWAHERCGGTFGTDTQDETNEINNSEYRLLDLNNVFTIRILRFVD